MGISKNQMPLTGLGISMINDIIKTKGGELNSLSVTENGETYLISLKQKGHP